LYFILLYITNIRRNIESCEYVLANNQINHKVFSICFLFSFKFFLHLLCISLVPLIFPYSAQILLENALLCRQNARLKNCLLCSKFCRQNLSKPLGGPCIQQSNSGFCSMKYIYLQRRITTPPWWDARLSQGYQ